MKKSIMVVLALSMFSFGWVFAVNQNNLFEKTKAYGFQKAISQGYQMGFNDHKRYGY